jgi:hypothetical protein
VKKLTSFITLLCLLCLHHIQANEHNLVTKIFQQSYNQDYHPLTCTDNIMALGQRLIGQGINPKRIRVLFLRHKHAPYVAIHPLKQRLTFQDNIYSPSSWTFHSVLILGNDVLDLDYTDKPTMITIANYFDNMWSLEEREQMIGEVKPFSQYSKADFGGRFSRPVQPPQALNLLIENLQLD